MLIFRHGPVLFLGTPRFFLIWNFKHTPVFEFDIGPRPFHPETCEAQLGSSPQRAQQSSTKVTLAGGSGQTYAGMVRDIRRDLAEA